MKKILLIFFILFTGIASGQTNFESPYTQFLDSGDVEPIERVISITPAEIKITSTNEEGEKVIQILLIKDVIDSKRINEPLIKTFYCTSLDEQVLYQVSVPFTENIEQIILTQLNLATGEVHDLRFLIDSKETLPLKKVRFF